MKPWMSSLGFLCELLYQILYVTWCTFYELLDANVDEIFCLLYELSDESVYEIFEPLVCALV